MNAAATLSPDQILGLTSPTQIFSSDPDANDAAWKRLASKWHPDKAPAAEGPLHSRVFAHLKSLYEKAVEMTSAGVWGNRSLIHFDTSRDTVINLAYIREETVDGFGTQFIGKSRVCYLVPDSNEDLVGVWSKNLERMAAEAHKYQATHLRATLESMDAHLGNVALKDGSRLVTVLKDPEFLCLKHVLEKGPLPAEHATWIMTRLYNLAAMMQEENVPNLDLSARSVFIHPLNHSVFLSDGWQYAQKFRSTVLAIPARTARLCPTIVSSGQATIGHVLTLIQALGRECLGSPSDAHLLGRKDVPAPMKSWITSMAGGDAVKESIAWSSVKDRSFGPPKYVKLELTETDVYGV